MYMSEGVGVHVWRVWVCMSGGEGVGCDVLSYGRRKQRLQ